MSEYDKDLRLGLLQSELGFDNHDAVMILQLIDTVCDHCHEELTPCYCMRDD